MKLLETFLDEHLIGQFHGETFECINVVFLDNAPQKAKEKAKRLYGTFSLVQLIDTFQNNNSFNISDFQRGLSRVEDAIRLTKCIESEPADFHFEELLAKVRS
ncbi:hypothetical protein GE107_23065 [Cohnella sp. CFH 77786]|uniref:hypothetical protein n=1 Tax=Cohnella sp. CFH 77786 TaxID=2662265 RepID=UPI001C6103D6|nr:hypothetical protein [Cohnella sp. CFH 77786]MBW5448926.1 hypothetical protein [Cohnella sp. CFH 77786]